MNKTKVYNILDLGLWIVNPFIIVLAVFDNKIEPGLFLLWTGKMHPLALHFPIVFGMLIGMYFLFFSKKRFEPEIEKTLLAVNALSASVVALFGIYLAMPGAYEGEIFILHKWGGIAIAFFSWLLLFLLNVYDLMKKLLAVIFIGILVGTTHKGAQITHGENALSFPVREVTPGEERGFAERTSTIFEAAVAPILNQKCVSCHGPDKVKGDLRLDSQEHILRGGESGDILTASLSGDPILLQLIHLPIENDDHMPPNGKLQLTKNEKAILQYWIKSGSNFDAHLEELSQKDSLLSMVEVYIAANQKVEVKTGLPDLDAFNTDYCTVKYLFYGTDEVEANFFQASFYKRETLKDLLKIKDYVVRLNMQNMPLEKEDIDIIMQFQNLEKINLNSTGLGVNEIKRLKSLNKLQNVAICGINFNESELDDLLDNSGFTSINVWTDNLNAKYLHNLVEKYPLINFIIGDNLEDKMMQINPPVIEQDSLIIKSSLNIKIKHLLNGVDIYYTTNGNEPDSLSKKYSVPINVTQNTVLKTKAYKTGWLSSEIVQRTFYKSGITPDTIYLSESPHPKYPGEGAKTLIDRSLGETNVSNGEWLGYRDYDLEFTIGFNQLQLLKKIELNALTNINRHIFPLKSIGVQGSNDGQKFVDITNIDFPVVKEETSTKAELFVCKLPENTTFKYYRVTVSNLKNMPSWHQAKGKPAWIFIDEIFLN